MTKNVRAFFGTMGMNGLMQYFCPDGPCVIMNEFAVHVGVKVTLILCPHACIYI